jgi:SAM-dependent methyltransferase
MEAQFNYEESWALKTAPIDAKESERIRQTIEILPDNIRSVLDAGCGDGRVSTALAAKYQVVGVDVSHNALRRGGNRNRVIAALLWNLPFRSETFDLVLVSEVIEHIPADVLPQVLREILRISRRYVLITVPYRETLEDASVRCRCGFVFHKWGHLQQFNERKLASLYQDLPVRKMIHLGSPKPADPAIFKKLSQRWAGRYASPDSDTLCPNCGGCSFETGNDNLVSRLFGSAGALAGRILPERRSTWIGGLFEKQADN